MAHEIKNILFVCVCVCGGGGGGGGGCGMGEVVHLFQTLCVGGGVGDKEGDSLISNCIEKFSQ